MNSKIEPPAEHQPRPASQPRVVWNWAKAFALVAVTGILASAFLLRECGKHTERLAQIAKETATDGIAAVAGAFKPTINVNSTISTTVSRMRDAAKLVVLVEEVDVTVQKTSDKSVLNGKLNLGTTTVTVRASGNRIQYYVPLDKITPDDFAFDLTSNRLTLRLAVPAVDEEMVEVQSDPAKIEVQTDIGWARLDKYSGQALRDEAKRDLRPAVIEQGRAAEHVERAKANTKAAVEKLMAPLLAGLKSDVIFQVAFTTPLVIAPRF